MKKWITNWAISGFRSLELKAGEIIEAAEDEVKHLLHVGAITLATDAAGIDTDDTTAMTTDQLVAYAKAKFEYTLEATLTKDAMLAEIASLEAGTQNDDPDTGAPDPNKPVVRMNKAELVAYAKATYTFDLDPTLSKAAMVIEIEALAAQKA